MVQQSNSNRGFKWVKLKSYVSGAGPCNPHTAENHVQYLHSKYCIRIKSISPISIICSTLQDLEYLLKILYETSSLFYCYPECFTIVHSIFMYKKLFNFRNSTEDQESFPIQYIWMEVQASSSGHNHLVLCNISLWCDWKFICYKAIYRTWPVQQLWFTSGCDTGSYWYFDIRASAPRYDSNLCLQPWQNLLLALW